ncbi:MAG: class I SAM-dependent methyltransferase [Planctomycetota bacterium]|jgi:ubiquinone/menaquinone biosynthesis C-methylase UbiE
MIGQDKAAEQKFYDVLFQTRQRFDQFQDEIYERIAVEARRETNGGVALDLGCGSGIQSLCLIDQGFSVVAVDLSLEATKLAKKTVASAGKSFLVLNADAEYLPIQDAAIDACICGLLLHHFKRLDIIAAELQRIVRPGGVVVAIDANAHNPFSWLFFNGLHRLRPLSGLTPNQRALRCSEIDRVFSKYGFGEFRFVSITSRLNRDWLGNSFGAKLNFYTRAAVLKLSRMILPSICHGNMLLSVFCRLPNTEQVTIPISRHS